MTVKAQEWAKRQRGLTSGERCVLNALADAINQDHEFCFPGQDRIAEECEKTVRHVRRCINRLVELGLIRVEKGSSRGRGKGRTTARYFLACDHRTGEDRPFTAGHAEPLASNTTGHVEPAVSAVDNITTGQNWPLQGDIFGQSPTPPNIAEPEEEPEKNAVSAPKAAKKPPKPKRQLSGDDIPGFPELWAEWDAKDVKPSNARKPSAAAFRAALKTGVDPEDLARMCRKYLQHPDWAKNGGVHLKGMTPFLNQEVWRDMLAREKSAGARSVNPKIFSMDLDTQRFLADEFKRHNRWPSDAGPPLTGICPEVRREYGLGAAA